MIYKQPKTEGYNAKYLHDHLEMASVFDQGRPYVTECRRRYLESKIAGIMKEVTQLRGYQGKPDDMEFAAHMMTKCHKVIDGLRKDLRKLMVTVKNKDTITDEMMAIAREAPVDSVIDFTKGTAFAFCHTDKTPSLKLMSKTGRAWCSTCNKYFNAVDILVQRDKMQFLDAVRMLNSH